MAQDHDPSSSPGGAVVSLLRCPQTASPLRLLEPQALRELNEQIASGQAVDGAGRTLDADTTLEAGLVTEDGRFVYPIRRGVPVLLLSERIVTAL